MDIIPQKPCNKCGETKPLTEFTLYKGSPRRWCKACVSEYNRAYNEKNTERRQRLWKEWSERNKAKLKVYRQKYYADHKEYYIQKYEKDCIERPEVLRERLRIQTKTPRGRIRSRLYASKRRALERQGDVTADQIQDLMSRQAKCAYCKRRFSEKLPATIDHVIPLSRGGKHTISNLVLACKSCNSRKQHRMIYLI